MTALSRRELLLRTGPVVLGALGGAALLGSACARRDPLASSLVALFERPDRARAVGEAVVESRPDEADAEALLAALVGDDASAFREAAGQGTAALRALVSARVRDDFAAGRTVLLDGWLLSVSEVRLYALAAVS